MKVYAQFITLSSGLKYDNGKMVEVEKQPIDALGSDGVFILDGRNSLLTLVQDSKNRMDKLKNVQSYIGFKIIRANKFSDKGTVLFTSLGNK